MARKRDRTDIIHDMLDCILQRGGEIKPTHLMYRSNLSHKQMGTYLDDLVEMHCVEKIQKKGYDYIIITDKGRELVNRLQEMKEFEATFRM